MLTIFLLEKFDFRSLWYRYCRLGLLCWYLILKSYFSADTWYWSYTSVWLPDRQYYFQVGTPWLSHVSGVLCYATISIFITLGNTCISELVSHTFHCFIWTFHQLLSVVFALFSCIPWTWISLYIRHKGKLPKHEDLSCLWTLVRTWAVSLCQRLWFHITWVIDDRVDHHVGISFHWNFFPLYTCTLPYLCLKIFAISVFYVVLGVYQ